MNAGIPQKGKHKGILRRSFPIPHTEPAKSTSRDPNKTNQGNIMLLPLRQWFNNYSHSEIRIHEGVMQHKSGLFPDPLLKKSRTFGGVVETTRNQLLCENQS